MVWSYVLDSFFGVVPGFEYFVHRDTLVRCGVVDFDAIDGSFLPFLFHILQIVNVVRIPFLHLFPRRGFKPRPLSLQLTPDGGFASTSPRVVMLMLHQMGVGFLMRGKRGVTTFTAVSFRLEHRVDNAVLLVLTLQLVVNGFPALIPMCLLEAPVHILWWKFVKVIFLDVGHMLAEMSFSFVVRYVLPACLTLLPTTLVEHPVTIIFNLLI
uniref:Uncharacterized protein n=2 Tax=Cacopsylla melanoneura TaxID=428564 RepID=A0A8D9B324_9HEMI